MKTSTARFPTPAPSDFTSPKEVLVDVKDGPDDLGRYTFTAFWLTDQEWVPNGVRGQVFSTNLATWMKRNESFGDRFRLVGARADEFPALLLAKS